MKSAFFLILFCIGSLISAQVVEDSLTRPVEIKSSRTLDNGVVSISRTEFLTFAGAFDDPTRLLIKYPGISTANDQANSVIYHGLPSQYHQWQFYGARILNPNHQSNAGTVTDNPSRSSGGVNMLSGQVIGEMNFYGNPSGKSLNSLAGNSDVKLRDPYRDNLQFNLSLIGLEAGVDQTFGKDNNKSLMLNYRYSTVGLLTDLGLDFGGETIKYSDLTAKYSIDTEKDGHFDIYAIYGRSTNDKDTLRDPQFFKDYQQINYEKTNLTAGIHHHKELSKSSKFSQTLNFSTVSEGRRAQEFFSGLEESVQDYNLDETLVSYNATLKKRRNTSELGLVLSANYTKSKFSSSFILPQEQLDHSTNPTRMEVLFNAYIKKKQKYGWSYEFKPGILFNTERKETFFIGFISCGYSKGAASTSISISSSKQEILPEWHELFNSEYQSRYTPSYHAQLKFRWSNLSLSPFVIFFESSSFYDDIYFDDFSSNTYYFSDINLGISGRSASNVSGIDLRYQKNIKGFEFSPSFTLMSSIYGGRKLPFDFGHIANIHISKKWRFSTGRYLGISVDFHHRGGARQQRVDIVNPSDQGLTRYERRRESQIQLSNYYRFDTRIYYIIKKGKYKSTISLDIQNMTNRENDAYFYYEPTTQSSRLQKQLGLLPVLSWRLSI